MNIENIFFSVVGVSGGLSVIYLGLKIAHKIFVEERLKIKKDNIEFIIFTLFVFGLLLVMGVSGIILAVRVE